MLPERLAALRAKLENPAYLDTAADHIAHGLARQAVGINDIPAVLVKLAVKHVDCTRLEGLYTERARLLEAGYTAKSREYLAVSAKIHRAVNPQKRVCAPSGKRKKIPAP